MLAVSLGVAMSLWYRTGLPFGSSFAVLAAPAVVATLLLGMFQVLLPDLGSDDGRLRVPQNLTLPLLHTLLLATVAMLVFVPTRPVQRLSDTFMAGQRWLAPEVLVVLYIGQAALLSAVVWLHRRLPEKPSVD